MNIGGGSSSQQFTYDYDNNKNIINRTQNGTTDQFTYDSLSRIESEQSDGKDKTFTYDDQGNRLTIAGGQISGLKNRKYTFDTLDRLIGVTGQGQGKETIDVTYSYNGDGLLYERVTKDQRIRYYYDEEGKLLAEATVGADNAARVSYFYIYDLDGRLWARQSKTNGMEYYQFNGHGDVVGLTDKDGNELNSYSYDIWGNPTNEKEDVPNVFRYSSEYWDSDTGLQYLRARWYDPNTARFVSRDTYEGELTNPLSMNLYSYVSNNPLRYIDPSGNKLESTYGYDSLLYKFSRTSVAQNANLWLDLESGKKQCKTTQCVANFESNQGKLEKANDNIRNNACNYIEGGCGEDGTANFISSKNGIVTISLNDAKNTMEFALIKDFGVIQCNCFTSGTSVLTINGEKPIEDIQIGDKVLAKNDVTGEMSYQDVEMLFRKNVEETYNITVNGEIITTTDEHPFWIVNKGWVKAKDLNLGDELVTDDEVIYAIEKIEAKKEHVTVYNFRVKDYHTYYVSNLHIWTHNQDSCGKVSYVDTTGSSRWVNVGNIYTFLTNKGYTISQSSIQTFDDMLKVRVNNQWGRYAGEIHVMQPQYAGKAGQSRRTGMYFRTHYQERDGKHYYDNY